MVSYFSYYISTCTVHITKVDKILSTREGLLCSKNLVGPRICGVNQLLVSTSRNSFTSLFLSKFSRLIFKSPVNITFLFSIESALRVCFKYHKNSVSFCFGCLYIYYTSYKVFLACVHDFNPVCLIFTLRT